MRYLRSSFGAHLSREPPGLFRPGWFSAGFNFCHTPFLASRSIFSSASPGSPAAQAALISSMNTLQQSIAALSTHLLPAAAASRVAPASRTAPALTSSEQPNQQLLQGAFSLAEARPGSSQGQPYVPAHAHVSARLRSKILQGQNINLVSMLLPSPVVDRQVATSSDFTAVFRTADPRLSRDLAIGEFVAAFGVYRDVICSVYPERRVELDSYLALTADLNLKYGRSLFYQYHKAFSSKAASVRTQSGVFLNWFVLDTELLVMLTHATPFFSCSAVGHRSALCPTIPLSRPRPLPQPARSTVNNPPTDRYGRKVEVFNDKPICNNFNRSRLILDLSAPHCGPHPSINSLIPKTPFSLSYASVDHAISLIKTAGRNAWLAKADISDAFKIMPVHPSQWHLLGAKWDGAFYFAVRLSFGCRSSPSLFDNLSEALCWVLLNVIRIPAVLHLLDDFLLVDAPSPSPGTSLARLRQLFLRVGVPLSEEKTVGPATRLEFLGITLDSDLMIASLPEDKLARIREFSQAYVSAEFVSKRQLLSLLGHLNFAIRIIPQGRSFISRLLDLANSVPSLLDRVSLDDGCRSDLVFWSKLLSEWNGISFFYDDVVLSADSLRFFTDAAPSSGFGGFFQGCWFADKWPPSFPQTESSAFYEIIPIAAACCLWGHLWRRKRISARCNNLAMVEAINKGRSSVKSIMPYIRRITWQSVTENFILSARHVPGHSNLIADALSRSKFQVFRRLCPSAESSPIQCLDLEDLALH
ncbi:uncharacterized protein LOC142397143 [Odontesthes bonariensis]|uniref:uncharacterized protein LOC142397143 n=1 Tax=Odontesthes bonariensis TaxID=219752 RepID=UPI003F58075E